jgi:uncharacterized membrane protein YfcA
MIFGFSIWIVLACFVLAAIGASVQGAMGFGMGMLISPILKMIDHGFVPGAVLIAVIPLSAGVAIRERQCINWRGFGWAIAGRIPGIFAASAALAYLSERGLSIAVGSAVLVAVAVSLTSWRIHPTYPNLAVAGLGSGFMGTITSVGGPPMAIAYQHADPRERQATLAAFFGVGSVISVCVLAFTDKIGGRQLTLSAFLLPGVAVGIVASRWLVGLMGSRYSRPAILAMSTASALILLAQQF